MTPTVEELVREAMELTGAAEPTLLDRDAPVLDSRALEAQDGSFYLVGLIGGKDVGKSALVNALAGRNITQTSAYGPGTESVIAYAHVSQEKPLRELLDRQVPGQYRIVTHELAALRRQVLLDLPDFDSHFASHLQITRTMLRHMLFPVWLVSIEKYADRQPQQMLSRVAEGNTPQNFIFALNKVDQLPPASQAASELREDYARRVQRTLALPSAPPVYMISATHPESFDLPKLRAALSQEKTPQVVKQSQELAAERQDRFLLAWLDHQQLPQRARRLAELQEEVQELSADRIAGPLVDVVIPRLLDDPETRGALAEEILTERVARWPIVRLVHTLLSPLFVLLRGATSRNAAPLQTPEGLVEIVLKETGYSPGQLVQITFAQLRQSRPDLATLYAHNKLWEQMPADLAAAELRRTLAATLERQRDAARAALIRRDWLGALPRWLLTIGAVIWFPFAQPILQTVLGSPDAASWTLPQLLRLVVSVLGVDYLLKSVGFLIIYFIALWLALRWNTQRKVARVVSQWRETNQPDSSLSLFAQTLQWLDGLVTPVRQACDRMESLASRTEAARDRFGKAA
ncbi:MAG TPA: GTPase domain-containing protein [Tepidisphaeraceae bacterium]|nr:GTPase domain-containing protein [Tepidisphaeraceae bacterium]